MEEQAQPQRVQLDFVEQPIQLTVDMARLTWGDLLEMQRLQQQAQAEEGSQQNAVELLSSLVTKITGENAMELPAIAVNAVIQAIMTRTTGAGVQAKN